MPAHISFHLKACVNRRTLLRNILPMLRVLLLGWLNNRTCFGNSLHLRKTDIRKLCLTHFCVSEKQDFSPLHVVPSTWIKKKNLSYHKHVCPPKPSLTSVSYTWNTLEKYWTGWSTKRVFGRSPFHLNTTKNAVLV